MAANKIRWKIRHPIKLRDWPEQPASVEIERDAVILFVPATGDIHLITPAARDVLNRLQESPCAPADLFQELKKQDGFLSGLGINSIADLNDAYMYPFEELGIIEKTL